MAHFKTMDNAFSGDSNFENRLSVKDQLMLDKYLLRGSLRTLNKPINLDLVEPQVVHSARGLLFK